LVIGPRCRNSPTLPTLKRPGPPEKLTVDKLCWYIYLYPELQQCTIAGSSAALGGTAGQVYISGNRASGDSRHRNPRQTAGCTFRAVDAGSGAAQPRHRPRLPVIRQYSGIGPDRPPSCACIGAGQTASCRRWRFAGQLPASIEPRSTLTLYHIDGAALARCTALIDDRGSAATSVERMAARLLAAVSRPNAAECTKGRFFDHASDKLSQLARFANNELVSFDLLAMASALADKVTSKPDGALSTDRRLTCPSALACGDAKGRPSVTIESLTARTARTVPRRR
jgi:hypothetical protein